VNVTCIIDFVNFTDLASAVTGTCERLDFEPGRRRSEVLIPRLQELVTWWRNGGLGGAPLAVIDR
jgi:hypothetical protein